MQGKLTNTAQTKSFALAGNATLTIQSVKSGTRFTFRIRECEDKEGLFFVSLLIGSNNESDFRYLGTVANILDHETGELVEALYRHGKKSKIEEDAPGAKAFAWIWKRIRAGVDQNDVEVFHEGKCGRCARKLTVPSSIESGFGPECAAKMGFVCEEAA